jgi:hypothetical protein
MTCTQERFLGDVKSHQMTIIRDDGADRHLRFRQPDSSIYWFEILTWPNALCIRGDCGTYVFSRLTDMFEFFRKEPRGGQGLFINTEYWAEKLIACNASGRHDAGAQRFCLEKFHRRVEEAYAEFALNADDDVNLTDLHRELEHRVLLHFDYENEAIRAACEFSHEDSGFDLHDFWEINCREWDFCFVWCLHAISWGIRKYDEARAELEVVTA